MSNVKHPDAPTPIGTITDGDITVEVLLDTDPTMRAVLVHLDDYGQELHLPIAVAREVAAAIMAAIPD